jgi:hypothetical protein
MPTFFLSVAVVAEEQVKALMHLEAAVVAVVAEVSFYCLLKP